MERPAYDTLAQLAIEIRSLRLLALKAVHAGDQLMINQFAQQFEWAFDELMQRAELFPNELPWWREWSARTFDKNDQRPSRNRE